MATFKCANIKYASETMTNLVFWRRLIFTQSSTLYLRSTITTANWEWQSGGTQKDITLDSGTVEKVFDFKYTGTMPTSSGKYNIAVNFDYYSDSGYTNLLFSESHTFELHFYHSSDFSTYVYDHAGLDNSLSSDNGLISLSWSYSGYGYYQWQTALIEGTGCFYGNSGSNGTLQLKISNIPANKFLVLTYVAGTPYGTEVYHVVNGKRQPVYQDGPTKKFVFYSDTGSTYYYIEAVNQNPYAAWFKVDGVYVFNEI